MCRIIVCVLPLFVLIAALFLSSAVIAKSPAPNQYQLKAVILYKFLPFIEWPDVDSPTKKGALNICVLGKDPFGKESRILEKQSSSKRKIKIWDNISLSEIKRCHILYITKSEERNLKKLLNYVHGLNRPILTVSDINGFISRGGMIGLFINDQNKVKFEINIKSANLVRMKINAQMLEVAERVIDK